MRSITNGDLLQATPINRENIDILAFLYLKQLDTEMKLFSQEM